MSKVREKIKAKGFTLVELLVSLAIFSVLMTTAAYTLRMASTLLHKTDKRFAQETRNLSRLRDSIGSSYHFVGERRAMALAGREYYFHFYGGENELEYITSRPFAGAGLTLSRLRYQDGVLLLEESPIYSLEHDFKQPAMPSSTHKSQLLMKDLETFRIEYISDGVRTASVKEGLPNSVRISYKKPNMPEARELFVAIKSNFSDKKDLMEQQAPLLRGL